MKTIAYWALHYGKEYLAWSIRSVQDAVDEIHILYTDRPSFGHDTTLQCPDSEEELKREANRFLTKPMFWHKDRWPSESAHRNYIVDVVAPDRKADRVLVVDADELWAPGVAREALEASAGRSEKDVLARFMHFWRSLDWVCHDPCMPVRILNPRGSGTWYLSPQRFPVLHFGYAQSARLTQYKEDIHGHRSEWRQGWFEQKFMPWTPENNLKDVHPTNVNFWNPQPVSDAEREIVEKLLSDHPYHRKGVIL